MAEIIRKKLLIVNAESNIDQSRRGFLRGHVTMPADVLRPPWASRNFINLCTRCDDCINACGENILKRGDGGYPEIDFGLGGCELCEDCVTACRADALNRNIASPWKLKAHVKQDCLSKNSVICRSCGESCPQQAIQFRIQLGGVASPQINQAACDGCGHCYSVCPQKSIYLKEDK